MSSLYYRDSATELHVGDASAALRAMPTASVDCVVTSPPHWGLRDYGTATWTGGNLACRHTLGTTPHQRRTAKKFRNAGTTEADAQKRCRKCGARCHDRQYGLEPTPAEYVERILQVCSELGRVLTDAGTLWLNLRDSYSYHHNGTGRIADSAFASGWRVSHKSLLGLPWRIALAVQADGWILRNAVVWHKPNAIPDPATDRLASRYEMLFLLVKQADYHFDIDPIRQAYSPDRPARRKTHYGGNKPHTVRTPWHPGKGKNPGDVWSVSTRPLPDAHCAPFPVDLPLRCIAAGSPIQGRVLDPFSGAGTTGLAAHQLGHHYQGVDLRADYHDMFLRRRAGHPSGGWVEAA